MILYLIPKLIKCSKELEQLVSLAYKYTLLLQNGKHAKQQSITWRNVGNDFESSRSKIWLGEDGRADTYQMFSERS